jgi:hypothetical protein
VLLCRRNNHLKAFMYATRVVCLLQVISMVCHSVEVQQYAFLIVCPASVLSNRCAVVKVSRVCRLTQCKRHRTGTCVCYVCLPQVISMVCHSIEVQQCASPFLVVCPASVLSNWANELQHWAPDLSVVQYRGSADAREEIYRKQVR